MLHIDSLDVLDDLNNEQAGILFKAIKSHQLGEFFELDQILKIAFSPFKNQFLRDAEKYDKTCKARAEAGSKGGKQKVANASKSKQKVANLADSDSDSKNKNKSDSKSDSVNGSDNSKDLLSGKPDITNVINHFNSITGQRLKASAKSHSENISARLSEGHSVDDLKLVIDAKYKDWANDAKMAQYIRPSTLFQVGKFNGYLQQAKANPVQSSSLHDLSNINYESGDL